MITKFGSLYAGHVDFDDLHAFYQEQARGLLQGSVDLLQIETCQDPLQAKAGAEQFFEVRCKPGKRYHFPEDVAMRLFPSEQATEVPSTLRTLQGPRSPRQVIRPNVDPVGMRV